MKNIVVNHISTLEMVLWGLNIPYTVLDGRIYATVKDNIEEKDNIEDITDYSARQLKAFFGRVSERVKGDVIMNKEIIDNINWRKEELKRQLKNAQDRAFEIRKTIQRVVASCSVDDIKHEVENLERTTHECLDIKKRISLLNTLLEDEFS